MSMNGSNTNKKSPMKHKRPINKPAKNNKRPAKKDY